MDYDSIDSAAERMSKNKFSELKDEEIVDLPNDIYRHETGNKLGDKVTDVWTHVKEVIEMLEWETNFWAVLDDTGLRMEKFKSLSADEQHAQSQYLHKVEHLRA